MLSVCIFVQLCCLCFQLYVYSICILIWTMWKDTESNKKPESNPLYVFTLLANKAESSNINAVYFEISHTGCSAMSSPLWLRSAPQLCSHQATQSLLQSQKKPQKCCEQGRGWLWTTSFNSSGHSARFFSPDCGLISGHRCCVEVCSPFR